MKRLSLICFLSACAVLAEGCSNGGGANANTGTGGGGSGTGGAGNNTGTGGSAGTVGTGGAAGSGSAGKNGDGAGSGGAAGRGAGGANGGVSGTGPACPGVQPQTGMLCRTASDCPSGGYVCTSDPSGVSSACGGFCIAPVPRNDCTVDTDCPTGDVCLSSVTPCCGKISTTCALACTATSCGATQRCNAAGHCEVFPCTDGFTCQAGTVCSASATGADANGCVPQLCTAGYTCATGFQCAAGSTGADAHGCASLPCSQTGCPINSVCQTTATSGGCTTKKCSTDGDCDCGFCVGGTCASRLSVCVVPPS